MFTVLCEQKGVKIIHFPQPERSKKEVSLLGLEVVAEIKKDMQHTTIPSWIKPPPLNFATADHRKLASEEYKSLGIISLPITLIRLWTHAEVALQTRLTHFLHLSISVRILAYQSLTSYDINMFQYHYQQYLDGLKSLYPFCTVVPVQHLGLHIPYFLNALGPRTRYTENTCEMFIGILEDMSTNSRLGTYKSNQYQIRI